MQVGAIVQQKSRICSRTRTLRTARGWEKRERERVLWKGETVETRMKCKMWWCSFIKCNLSAISLLLCLASLSCWKAWWQKVQEHGMQRRHAGGAEGDKGHKKQEVSTRANWMMRMSTKFAFSFSFSFPFSFPNASNCTSLWLSSGNREKGGCQGDRNLGFLSRTKC